jgi:hypothetical protein
MRGRFEQFNARPGGSDRWVLTYEDTSTASGKPIADSDIVEARLVEVIPGVRVVQAVTFEADDPTFAGSMMMTWETPVGPVGTRVDIRGRTGPT